MVKNSIFILLVCSLLAACSNDNPDVQNASAVGEKEWVQPDSSSQTEQLLANSAQEGDAKAMASNALKTLQSAYTAAKGKVTGVGEVLVKVDDNLNLIIENNNGGSTTTTTANLRSLDPDFSHLEILVNGPDNEFPGFRMKVLPGKSKVVESSGGSKKEMDYLEVKLAERGDVEKSISALTLAIEAVTNKLPQEK